MPLARRLPALLRLNPAVALVLVGDRPYAPSAVAAELGCPVAGVVADDVRAARVLAHGGSLGSLTRSALARTAAGLAQAVVAGSERYGGRADGSEVTAADEMEVRS